MALTLPKPHMSKSSIEMYLRCPKQFEFRYIKELKEPPGVALVQGISVHEALAMNNKHKAKQHEDLPTRTVVEKFEDEFQTRSFEVDKWSEPRDLVISQSSSLIQKYMATEAVLIQPVDAEMKIAGKFEYENGDVVNLLGFADVVEENAVGDYKVTGRRKSKNDMLGDLGFGLYAYLTGIRNQYFMLLLKQTEAKVAKQPIAVEDAQIAWTKELTHEVCKAISAGAFPPCDPKNWCCCPSYCGYYNRCRGAKTVLR